ncbi:GTPase IMAP family member 9 [Diretmus argenteus]
MDGSDDLPELRVVLLGRPGSETTKVGNTILGKKAFPLVDLKEAQKQTATIAGRQVTVAISPDWYSSSSTPADVKKHIGSFVNLSTPGPHAFLLCVPVTKPTDGEMKGMDMMENLFSPEAVSDHMIVLLTHTEELKEGEVLDDYLKANRRDIMKLVERCGDRHYVLKTQHDMDALLVEVEHSLIMSGSDHFECPLYEEAEARLLERQLPLNLTPHPLRTQQPGLSLINRFNLEKY